MSYSSEKVKRWRENTKLRMIEAMGGRCSIPSCGYNKCPAALEFHHLDKSIKDFGFGAIRANPTSWKKIVKELNKCVLLCANCHREVHYDLIDVPVDAPTFDPIYEDYKLLLEKPQLVNQCPVCNKNKPVQNKTCSLVCSGIRKRRVDWDKYDLKELLKTMTVVAIADMLDVSDMAVRKRLKRIGLTKPYR